MKLLKNLSAHAQKTLKIVCFCVLCVALIGSVIGGVYAKYVQQSNNDMFAKAKAFYFTSDLLVEGGKTYQLNPNTTEITFTLRNYADELRHADDPIQCTYTLTVDDTPQTPETFTLSNTQNTSHSITINDLQPGSTYRVEVLGVAGYQKTLSATFVVLEHTKGFYRYLDVSDPYFVQLTVWTAKLPDNASGAADNVKITIPDGLIPDRTNPTLKSVSGNIFTVTLGEYQSATYRFFKENVSTEYTVENFTATMTPASGTEDIPATTAKP